MKLTLERVTPIIAKALRVTPYQLTESFRTATEDDFEEIVEFRKNYFNENQAWDDRVYLKWRFDFNESSNECSNKFWILRIGDEILGVIGVECFDLVVNGVKKVARHPSDLLVKPNVNGLGVGAWLNLMIQKKYPTVIAVGSTEQSLSLIKKLFVPVSNCQNWKYLVSVKGTIRRITNNSLIALAGSLLVDRVLLLQRKKYFKKYNDKSLIVKKIKKFDSSVDEWDAPFRKTLIYRKRNSDYLNWRFLGNPRQNYLALGIYKEGVLLAYSIYHLHYSSQNRQVEGLIDDFFWKSSIDAPYTGEAIFPYLMNLTINELVLNDAKLIDVSVYSHDVVSQLSSMGFKKRGDRDIFAVFSDNDNDKKILLEKENWFLTSADMHGDNI